MRYLLIGIVLMSAPSLSHAGVMCECYKLNRYTGGVTLVSMVTGRDHEEANWQCQHNAPFGTNLGYSGIIRNCQRTGDRSNRNGILDFFQYRSVR